MPLGIPRGAMCVQRFDDSLNSAIHITYRISLRSSSMPEPRDPLLKVLTCFCIRSDDLKENGLIDLRGASKAPRSNVVGKQGLGVGGFPPLNPVMILPQVHLRKPCYDFYFL